MGILVALPIAAAIAILDRKKIEEFLFLAIGIIISLIFVSGYFGNTLYGVGAAVITGAGATIYCLVMFIRDKARFKESVLTPGFFWGLTIFTVLGILLIGRTDLGDDNDTFWAHAPQILNMYRYSDLGNIGRRMVNYSLLYTAPVYTSWCYFCNRLWLWYSDGINLWAWQIFIISGLLPFFSFTAKGGIKKQILIAILIFILPNIVICSYNFMPDIPLASAMAYGTVMTIRLYRDRNTYNDWGYMLGACMSLILICIMKRIGGMCIYGIVGLTAVYTIDRIRTKEPKIRLFRKLAPLIAMLGSATVTFSFTFFMNAAYKKYYYDNYGTADYPRNYNYVIMLLAGMAVYIALGIIIYIFKVLIKNKKYIAIIPVSFIGIYVIGYVMISKAMDMTVSYNNDPESVRGIFFRFFEMWLNREYFSGNRFGRGWVLSDGMFVLILVAIIVVMGVFIAKGKLLYDGTVNDLINSAGTVFLGYIVYMFFYCFIYMVKQGGYMSGDSFGYTDRYLGPALMLVAVVVLYELLSIKNIDHNIVLVCAIVFLMLLLPDNIFRVLSLDNKDYWGEYNKMYADSGVELSEEDNVLCLGPDHCQYYVFPAKSVQSYEAAECELSQEDWSGQVIRYGYNYLVLEDYSSEFPETYQDMFEGGLGSIKKMAIYSVKVDADNKVSFVPCRSDVE